MTVCACVRCSERDGEVWTRDAKAVIVAWIDDHVGGRRHVAGDAGRARARLRMMVVPWSIVFCRQVATRTKRIARRAHLASMRIVTVAARHTARIHAALEERAPGVDFVALLAVRVIRRARQQRRTIVVKERLAGFVSVCDLTSTRMTLCARLDLTVGRAGSGPGRIA